MPYLHIITRKLLSGFVGDQGLRQLIKADGRVKPTPVAPKNTGGEDDPWPEEIETKTFQRLDNDAHHVLTKIIRSNGSHVMTADQVESLRKWMLFFIIRSTTNRQTCISMIEEGERTGDTKASMLLDLQINIHKWFAAGNCKLTDKGKQQLDEMGEGNFKKLMYDLMARRIMNDELPRLKAEDLWHHMLATKQMRQHGRAVYDMKWTWLRSETDLVIGDNPFCRSQVNGVPFGYPLNRADLEVFFPISRKLCLWMHRTNVKKQVVQIRNMVVTHLNRRQIDSSLEYAWGPTEAALLPKWHS